MTHRPDPETAVRRALQIQVRDIKATDQYVRSTVERSVRGRSHRKTRFAVVAGVAVASVAAAVVMVGVFGQSSDTPAPVAPGAPSDEPVEQAKQAVELEAACPQEDRAQGYCPLDPNGVGLQEWERFKTAFPVDLRPFFLTEGVDEKQGVRWYHFSAHVGDPDVQWIRLDLFIDQPIDPQPTQPRVEWHPEDRPITSGLHLTGYRRDGTTLSADIYGEAPHMAPELKQQFRDAIEELIRY